jgi:hypothetical protein
MEYSPSSDPTIHSAAQEIPHLLRTRKFITVFKRARHHSLLWARWIQSTLLSPYFPKIHSNIIFPSTPTSFKWSLPFKFSDQNIATCYMSQSILHGISTLIALGESYALWRFSLCGLLKPPATSALLHPQQHPGNLIRSVVQTGYALTKISRSRPIN